MGFIEGMKSSFRDCSGNARVKTVAAVALLFVFTIFVLQNTEVVEITFLFWRVNLSRVLLLIGSLAVGCLVGVLIGLGAFAGKKKQGNKGS